MPKARVSKQQRIINAQKELEKTLTRVGYTGKAKTYTTKKKEQTAKQVCSDAIPENGIKKTANLYTGDQIAGIVVTHKSNLMPVRRDNKQELKSSAQMRR